MSNYDCKHRREPNPSGTSSSDQYKVHVGFKHAHFENSFVIVIIYAKSEEEAIEQAKKKVTKQISGIIGWEKIKIVSET